MGTANVIRGRGKKSNAYDMLLTVAKIKKAGWSTEQTKDVLDASESD